MAVVEFSNLQKLGAVVTLAVGSALSGCGRVHPPEKADSNGASPFGELTVPLLSGLLAQAGPAQKGEQADLPGASGGRPGGGQEQAGELPEAIVQAAITKGINPKDFGNIKIQDGAFVYCTDASCEVLGKVPPSYQGPGEARTASSAQAAQKVEDPTIIKDGTKLDSGQRVVVERQSGKVYMTLQSPNNHRFQGVVFFEAQKDGSFVTKLDPAFKGTIRKALPYEVVASNVWDGELNASYVSAIEAWRAANPDKPAVFIFSSKDCGPCRTHIGAVSRVLPDYGDIQVFIVKNETFRRCREDFGATRGVPVTAVVKPHSGFVAPERPWAKEPLLRRFGVNEANVGALSDSGMLSLLRTAIPDVESFRGGIKKP